MTDAAALVSTFLVIVAALIVLGAIIGGIEERRRRRLARLIVTCRPFEAPSSTWSWHGDVHRRHRDHLHILHIQLTAAAIARAHAADGIRIISDA